MLRPWHDDQDTPWAKSSRNVEGGETKRINWISSSKLGQTALARQPENRPVRVCAGARADGLARRDLLVSRQHRMLVDSKVAECMFGIRNALISAIKLTALPGIYVDGDMREVEYFHIFFDQDEVIWAEGAPSASLLTAPEALRSVPASARAGLTRLFPQLNSVHYKAKSAALIPSGKAQKELVGRHVKNAKVIFAPVPAKFGAQPPEVPQAAILH